MEPRPIYIGTAGMVDTFFRFKELRTIEDTTYLDKPYAEDTEVVNIRQDDSWTFSIRMESKVQKTLYRLLKRGNNWRRMHGMKLIRVPLRERRKHKRLNIPQ